MRVFSQGSFDLLHSGHIKLLRRCKQLAGQDEVIVSLLTDEAYESYRGEAPVIPYEQRKLLLQSLRFVDRVIPGDNRNTEKEILAVSPDIVAVGSDWAAKDIYAQYGLSQEWFDERNILLLFFPYTKQISSTDIKKRLCKKHSSS